MQINVTGQQIDVGDTLRSHIVGAIEGTTDRYFADANIGWIDTPKNSDSRA